MLKLLIVDDEMITRRGIIQQINFNEYDIDEIQEADDGLKALEIAKKFQPDIVISDIKMPRMDGMTFAFELKKIIPNCRIIFMSAYTELDYYRNAIKLNAISYIEKPIDLEEMKAAVKNAVNDLMQYLAFQNMSVKMNQMVFENRAVLKSQFSAMLTNPKSDPGVLEEKAKALNFDSYLDGNYMTVIITQYSKGHLGPYEQDYSRTKSNDILKAFLEPIHGIKVWHYKGSTIIIHLIAKRHEKASLSGNKIIKIFEAIYDEMERFCKPSIAIGKIVEKAGEAHASYLSAVITLERLFYKEGKLLDIYNHWVINNSFIFKTESLNDFTKYLEKADRKECIRFVQRLTHDIRHRSDLTKNNVKDIYFQLAQILNNFINLSIENIDQNDSLIWDDIASMVSLKELEEYLLTKISRYFNSIREQNEKNSLAIRVRQYVHLHYEDMTLSIDSIANDLNVSNSYMCAVFKKETGQTINKFITIYRIEKSKALLKDHGLKVEEVSKMVGYGDSDYFSKVFKRYALCTPTEYRKKYIV